MPELKQHLQSLVAETSRLLRGSIPADLDFVGSYARRRAQQRFPLEASLHTYRCSRKILSEWIRDAALAAADSSVQVRRVIAATADFSIEYIDAISTLATSEYVDHTRLLAEAEGDRRTELLNTLLRGYDESDNRTAQLLRRSGYLEQRQSFCVAVARSVDPREMENAPRAHRIIEAITHVLRDSPVRSLIGIRDGLVVVQISHHARILLVGDAGWTHSSPHNCQAAHHRSILSRLRSGAGAILY